MSETWGGWREGKEQRTFVVCTVSVFNIVSGQYNRGIQNTKYTKFNLVYFVFWVEAIGQKNTKYTNSIFVYAIFAVFHTRNRPTLCRPGQTQITKLNFVVQARNKISCILYFVFPIVTA